MSSNIYITRNRTQNSVPWFLSARLTYPQRRPSMLPSSPRRLDCAARRYTQVPGPHTCAILLCSFVLRALGSILIQTNGKKHTKGQTHIT